MKRVFSLFMAVLFVVGFASVYAMAYNIDGDISFVDSGRGVVLNEDGDNADGNFSVKGGKVTGDNVSWNQDLYFQIGDTSGTDGNIPADELLDSKMFSFKLVRDKNGAMLENVQAVTKTLKNTGRASYVCVKLKDSSKTDEIKVSFDVYFKAKKDSTSFSSAKGKWKSNDIINARFDLWAVNPKESGGDTTVETGEGTIFKPESNATNTIRWGSDSQDVACLEFHAASDAKDFYAKLSTKTDEDVYTEYGDPAEADLYFRSFTASSIDSTSRATLTLYNPWSADYGDNDDDNGVDPKDVYIYSLDADGNLEDISEQFTYVNADKTDAGIEGWQCKVRTLGSYVLSDVELDGYDNGNNDKPNENLNSSEANGNNDNSGSATPSTPLPTAPSTGSEDFVVLAGLMSTLAFSTIIMTRKRK